MDAEAAWQLLPFMNCCRLPRIIAATAVPHPLTSVDVAVKHLARCRKAQVGQQHHAATVELSPHRVRLQDSGA